MGDILPKSSQNLYSHPDIEQLTLTQPLPIISVTSIFHCERVMKYHLIYIVCLEQLNPESINRC